MDISHAIITLHLISCWCQAMEKFHLLSTCSVDTTVDKSRLNSVDSVMTESDMSSASLSAAGLGGYETICESEYETQFFGFTPKSFCDGSYNALLEYTWDVFRSAQDYMKIEFESVIKEEQLQKAREVILPRITKAIDTAFDKLEGYLLTNIFRIPNNVVAPEDKIQEEYRDFTKEDDMQLDREIQQLKDKIRAAVYTNACLRKELRQVDVVQKTCGQFLDTLTTMDKTLKQAGVSDLEQSMIFIAEKAGKMMAILDRLETTAPEVLQEPLDDETKAEIPKKKIRLGHS